MKKILLLTDFSEASRHALQFVRTLFADTVADFHLLCAHPIEADSFYSQKHVVQTAHTAFADQLHEWVSQLRHESNTDWHTFRATARPGTLLDVVRPVIDAEAYDWVVIGAKKDGTNELFGNSATALVRHLAANVLVIPADAPVRPAQHIVLAADFAQLNNCKLLLPLKELVTLKGALLTLLTITVPGKKVISIEQENRIRAFLAPIQPLVTHWQASDARQGIRTYLSGHSVDLLVTIPHHKSWSDVLSGNSVTRSLAYTPDVPLMTLYDDGHSDHPQLIEDLSTLDGAL